MTSAPYREAFDAMYGPALPSLFGPSLGEQLYGKPPEPEPRESGMNLTYELLAGPRSTVARVNLTLPTDNPEAPPVTLSAAGEARRQTSDDPDWQVGHLLALGRALASLGDLIERQGEFNDRLNQPIKFRFHLGDADAPPIERTLRRIEDVPLPDQGPPE